MVVDKIQEGLALEDFLQEFNDAPFELFDGERVLWMPSVAGHTEMIEMVKDAIKDFLRENPIGTVISEGTFILEYSTNWVKGSRIPDIMFYAKPRLEDYKRETSDWKTKPYVLVPELVIEIVSPNDSYSDINRKVDFYLQDGVQEIWVIDPQAENALVHQQEKTIRFSKTDKLSGNVLPKFEIELKQLFDNS